MKFILWVNGKKQRFVRNLGSRRGRDTTKQPVLGILCRNDIVCAEVVEEVGYCSKKHPLSR